MWQSNETLFFSKTQAQLQESRWKRTPVKVYNLHIGGEMGLPQKTRIMWELCKESGRPWTPASPAWGVYSSLSVHRFSKGGRQGQRESRWHGIQGAQGQREFIIIPDLSLWKKSEGAQWELVLLKQQIHTRHFVQWVSGGGKHKYWTNEITGADQFMQENKVWKK